MLCKVRLYRILTSLLSAFVLTNIVCNVPLVSAQQDSANFLTYTNTDLGFTIKYPSDWTVENAGSSITQGTGVTAIKFTSPASDFVVGVRDAEGSFNDLSTHFSQHPFGGGRLLEFNSNNYLLSGHPAIRTVTTQTFGSTDVKSLIYLTVLANKEYIVQFTTLQERFPTYLQTAQSMIDSFQIINKQ